MSIPARAFQASNRSQMVSNVQTTIAQGGGYKKECLVYQVGRTQWTNIALGTDFAFAWPSRTRAVTTQCLAQLPYTWTVNQSRPISSNLQPVPYWRIA